MYPGSRSPCDVCGDGGAVIERNHTSAPLSTVDLSKQQHLDARATGTAIFSPPLFWQGESVIGPMTFAVVPN